MPLKMLLAKEKSVNFLFTAVFICRIRIVFCQELGSILLAQNLHPAANAATLTGHIFPALRQCRQRGADRQAISFPLTLCHCTGKTAYATVYKAIGFAEVFLSALPAAPKS